MCMYNVSDLVLNVLTRGSDTQTNEHAREKDVPLKDSKGSKEVTDNRSTFPR